MDEKNMRFAQAMSLDERNESIQEISASEGRVGGADLGAAKAPINGRSALRSAPAEAGSASETWDDHEETAEEVRQRVRSASTANAIIIKPKPKPTIHDTTDKMVAVYGRVSTTSKEQVSSIENQQKYYDEKIDQTPNWHKQKIYMDEGKSGTSMKHREAFKEMLADAELGEMDLILCASVSRFARNVADCMTQVRLLRTMHPNKPIGVFFETENIYTLDPEAEKQLGMHALLADWESKNKSSRMILSYDQRIVTGQYPVLDLLGFRHTKAGALIIVEEEAKTIQTAYTAKMLGYAYWEIAVLLTEKKRPTLKGNTEWSTSMARNLFTNERRWGDLQARKTIVVDMVDRKIAKNQGDRVAAFVENHHKGIVSKEMAKAIQFLPRGRSRDKRKLPTIEVVADGLLRGFVSIVPGCQGFNLDLMRQASETVYSADEIAALQHEQAIRLGQEHSNVFSQQLHGYEVPPEPYFINRNVPTVTIAMSSIVLNTICRRRLDNTDYVEVLFHPYLQLFAVRECAETCPNAIQWKNAGLHLSLRSFCESLYETMGWNTGCRYKFRGVSRQRGDSRIVLFQLEEPVLLPSKRGEEVPVPTADEWRDQLNGRFNRLARRISEADITAPGSAVANPMIGELPSLEELEEQFNKLLMSM